MILTAVVLAHGDAARLEQTVRSVESALTVLAQGGIDCELLIHLEGARGDARRRAIAQTAGGNSLFEARVDESSASVGRSARDLAVRTARGEYIAICECGDLVSSDYLRHGLAKLRRLSKPSIVHPETIIATGERPSRWFVRP